jgi:primosomal replication protein N
VENRVVLTGLLAEQAALRYTPPDCRPWICELNRRSNKKQGSARNVNASVKAVAFGALAEKLAPSTR